MRKFSLFLLLASAAVPALAAPGDDNRGDRRNRGGEANERSENRQQRATQNRSSNDGDGRSVRGDRPDRGQATQRQGVMDNVRERVREQRAQRAQTTPTRPGNVTESVRSGRRGDRVGNAGQSTWRPRERQVRTIPDTRPNVTTQGRRGDIARTYDGRARRDYRDGNYRRWTNNWRNDRRYDWRRWRDHNRSLFRIGIYSDPFGWSYRRWSVGSFLYPSYYGSRYHLNDPWRYRLPPAYGPYRWVRYWDDALLVNIYTGQVVDVMHNFFW